MSNEEKEFLFPLNTGLVLHVKAKTYEEAREKAKEALYNHERIL